MTRKRSTLLLTLVLSTIMLAFLPVLASAASPCDGVDRRLTNEQKTSWAPVVVRRLAKEFKEVPVKNVDLLQSFSLDGWRIIYGQPDRSEPIFLFYAGDPLKGRYVTWWAGAAMVSEEKEMVDWTFKNAPGIPTKLARCFAWHVTNDRDQ
jgi:hypothetical protein